MQELTNYKHNASHDHSQNGEELTIHVIIDLEDLCLNKKPHPEVDPGVIVYYKIKVDKTYFEVKQNALTGEEILKLVGLTPSTHSLYEIGDRGNKKIAPDEKVSFTGHGIERFKSVGKEATDGIR